MTFSKNDLENIKTKISIINLLEKKTKLIKKGKDYWCCCPFHEEKTPSFKINDNQSSFYCFGCGAKGDIFTLYTDLYNYTFIDAVKELSKQAGLKIDFDDVKKTRQENKIEEILNLSCIWFQKNLSNINANICNQYLKKRKLTKETIEKFKLGYSDNSEITLYNYLKSKLFTDNDLLESNVVKLDKNKKIRDFFYKRLIFPIMNINGRVVGFGGRALDNSHPKYINSPESKIFQKRYLLYNLNVAKNFARKKDNLLICEGYMDVISLNQNGIQSVVAPLGTALTEDQLKLSWNYSTKPTIMFDGDNAGVRASYKSAIMALPLISAKKFLQFITLPIGYDPDSFINHTSFSNFIKELKKPLDLVEFIFNQSSETISLNNADEKILYDKYLDDLTETIKDKKTQYFYRREFKSLFFEKIRQGKNLKLINKNSRKKADINLNKKQNLSFFASSIYHLSIRVRILDELENSNLLNDTEKDFINELKKNEFIKLEKEEILTKFANGRFDKLLKDSLNKEIYQLFPYSSPIFDSQKCWEEVFKSIKNLNTRLLNLQKINKSLDSFINNSDSLKWSELQSINTEVLDEN